MVLTMLLLNYQSNEARTGCIPQFECANGHDTPLQALDEQSRKQLPRSLHGFLVGIDEVTVAHEMSELEIGYRFETYEFETGLGLHCGYGFGLVEAKLDSFATVLLEFVDLGWLQLRASVGVDEGSFRDYFLVGVSGQLDLGWLVRLLSQIVG